MAIITATTRKLIPFDTVRALFWKICDRLGVEPVLRHASLCLYNWGGGGQRDVLGGLQVQVTFTGTLDEAGLLSNELAHPSNLVARR